MLDMLINCTSFDHYTYKNAYRFTEVDGVPSQTLIGFTIAAQHAIAATNVLYVCFISRLGGLSLSRFFYHSSMIAYLLFAMCRSQQHGIVMQPVVLLCFLRLNGSMRHGVVTSPSVPAFD
jgi:hypothetical protein